MCIAGVSPHWLCNAMLFDKVVMSLYVYLFLVVSLHAYLSRYHFVLCVLVDISFN